MARKKKVKETYEEIAVVETLNATNDVIIANCLVEDVKQLLAENETDIREEIQKLNKRLAEISNLVNGIIVECNYNFGHDKSINKRIDNIIDAHERCKTLRNL